MSDRIDEDGSLASAVPGDGPTLIRNPIVIVEGDDKQQRYLLNISGLDPMRSDPRTFGIMISDLVDHIARAYADASRRDESVVRETILRTITRENKFKDADPGRGRMRGTTVILPARKPN